MLFRSKGGSDLIANRKFDVILANINLNVLLGDLNIYKNALNYNGQIIFSGVLEKDKYKLKDKCIANGLDFVEERKKDNWMLFHFSKSN